MSQKHGKNERKVKTVIKTPKKRRKNVRKTPEKRRKNAENI